MGMILDTGIWVDIERGRLSAGDVAAVTGAEAVYLTPVTLAELEYGVQRAPDAAARNRRAAALARLRGKPCLVIDKTTGEIFGRLAAQLDDLGRPARHRVQDLWIAALAIQHGFVLVTDDAHDFGDIPGLQVLPVRGERGAI